MIFKPHAYQSYCINRILQDAKLGLFLDMGLGKTIITLTAVNELIYNRWAVGRVLVIAPKKVAEATWTKEAQKWDHLQHLRIVPVLGSQNKRVRALNTPGNVYVVSRDNVQWLVDYYQQAWPFDMVVLDESTSFKNHNAKRFIYIRRVLPYINRLVELTGTPAPNGLEDLWAQIYLLDNGARLGKTITEYRKNFFEQDYAHPGQQFRTYSPRDGSDSTIRNAISDICVSMKAEDYLDLPECVEEIIPVVLDPKAEKAYKQLERELLLEVEEDTIVAGTAAALTGKLLQLCDGAVYGTEGTAIEVHNCKIEAFMETVEQLNGAHVLVFYNFKHDQTRILKALESTKLRVRSYTGPDDGDTWNTGEVDVLLAHPASCAYGLNLQEGGHHVIWFGLTWNLEFYQQANKRLHRQGQTQPVIVHNLVVQGGVDEDVIAALQSKGDTQEELMQALKARLKKYKGR